MSVNQIRNIAIVTGIAGALLVGNVFAVSVGRVHLRSHTDLTPYAQNANVISEKTFALRGNIYDRSGNVIAQDNRTYNIICILSSDRPSAKGQVAYVKDKEHTAEVLSGILDIDYETCLNYLQRDVYQTELGKAGRSITKDVKDEIESYHLPGIEFTNSLLRVYPLGQFAANLIGYATADETGLETGRMGIEEVMNAYLTGTDGSRTYQVDKSGYILPGMREEVVSAHNGGNVYLTIDQGIQEALESSFQMTVERFSPDAVYGGAMEIRTGKIIAWGQSPSFDPNLLNITEFNNIGAQLPYEPGSTMKTFTWAAAINEGKYDGDAPANGDVYCYTSDENGNPVRAGEDDPRIGCIYNARRIFYGTVTNDLGLMKSLNTVAASVQNEMINPATHLEYLKRFGFFQEVDTDGIPEANGILNWSSAADRLSLSYGQGSTATMLQLMQAYSAIFSDGTMVKPYFIDSIRDPYDASNVLYQGETEVVGHPITPETAAQVQDILTRTVMDENGSATHYQIPECAIMGKTGTTEFAVGGSYESGKTITSFMCALPADDPKVLVYYAFRGDYDPKAHVDTEAQVSFLRKVAMTYSLSDSGEEPAAEGEEEVVSPIEIHSYDMPDLINHSLAYGYEKLADTDTEIIVLGEGSSVIDQYPRYGYSVQTGQRVFLLTDTSGFTMPNLIGWTRKDVIALWTVSGYEFRIEGEGKVKEQSVFPGSAVSKGTQIVVKLE